jgi:glutathione peroxidase
MADARIPIRYSLLAILLHRRLESDMTSVYDFAAKTIDGREQPLSAYKGKVLLIVNVASQCGFTPQYPGLEKLQKTFGPQGFSVLGFPCNQFGAQEPGSEAEIARFCETKFGVTFPLFAKIDVNGAGAHPLYKFLTGEKAGVLGTEAIKWNFTKFLIDREGRPVARYGSATKPEALEGAIQELL